MSLSSLNLDAFFEVAKARSFSQAARTLHVSQSAVSQRVLNLEKEVGTTLLLREAGQVRLTALGENLFRYCQTKTALEQEALSTLAHKQGQLSGIIRIAAYSSISRSILMPALAPLLRKNENLGLELRTFEMHELVTALKTGETDYILIDRKLDMPGIESHLIGTEENVLVVSKKHKDTVRDVYLDHDAEDPTTELFFRAQTKRPSKITRLFFDDIYGIIDGVKLGLGKAVVSKHLIKHEKDLEILPNYKPLKTPIYLHHHQHPFYTRLHTTLLQTITGNVSP